MLLFASAIDVRVHGMYSSEQSTYLIVFSSVDNVYCVSEYCVHVNRLMTRLSRRYPHPLLEHVEIPQQLHQAA